jgi:exopolyphosphatase/guanosine-5'-triphosphate,3'-diphosphate pyrophosphatase
MVAEMQVMTRSEIRRIPGLEPKRVDLILAGSILLEEILYALNVRHLHVTEFALRDGILQTAIETAQPPKRRKKRR